MAEKYPDGKITRGDKGELELKIRVFKGRIIVEWGKPVKWIGFGPSEARAIADSLIKGAEEAERELKDLKS